MTLSTLAENRYQTRFATLEKQGHKAFIPFTLLGWPNRQTSLEIIQAMIDGGASALELGLAFSDPVSDGPVIQQAAMETLATGFDVDDAFGLIRSVRELDSAIPIGIMVYYNMVLARGIDTFFQDLADAGADGILIVDLPPEQVGEIQEAATQSGIQVIFIVSPLTSPERLSKMVRNAGGFLYIVSRLGITGTEARYDTDLQALLSQVHQATDLPCCVGFGISTPEQAQNMLNLGADGVITGSRVIQLVNEAATRPIAAEIKAYVQDMVKATKLLTPDAHTTG
jgi:tryptophan synthase alpha chain